jgi:hypothetical protein
MEKSSTLICLLSIIFMVPFERKLAGTTGAKAVEIPCKLVSSVYIQDFLNFLAQIPSLYAATVREMSCGHLRLKAADAFGLSASMTGGRRRGG